MAKRRSPRIPVIKNQRRDDANAAATSSSSDFETTRDQAPTITVTIDAEKVNNQQSSKPLSANNQSCLNAPTTKITTNDANQKGTTDTVTMTNHNDLSNTDAKDEHAAALENDMQCLVGGTSEKIVPKPMGEDITTDHTAKCVTKF